MNKALWHERKLYYINHPLTTLICDVVGRMRRCVYLPGVGYVVNDVALAREILNHPNFSSAERGGMGGMITPLVGANALINMDGLRHGELKQQLVKLFSRKYINQIIDEVLYSTLTDLQTRLEAGQEVDLVAVVHQLTNCMTCHMLGLQVSPTEGVAIYQEISELASKLTAFLKFEKLEPTPGDLVKARYYYDRLMSFAVFDQPENLDNSSLAQRIQSFGFSREETKGLLTVILLAGTEAVSAALPRIVALMVDSGRYQEIAKNQALLPAVIDEGLRVVCASPATLRGVSADLELSGLKFKKNRRVIILLYNILKQSTYFEHPRQFLPERQIPMEARNLWFGTGAHFCLGYMLAQEEIKAALKVLLNLDGTLKIVRRSYPRGQSLPGYTRLVVRLEQC